MCGDPYRPSVEGRPFDAPAVLVGLLPVEERHFELNHFPDDDAGGKNAEGNVGRIQKMVGDRCDRVVSTGSTMHERRGA